MCNIKKGIDSLTVYLIFIPQAEKFLRRRKEGLFFHLCYLFQTTHQTNSHSQRFFISLVFSPLVLYTLGHKKFIFLLFIKPPENSRRSYNYFSLLFIYLFISSAILGAYRTELNQTLYNKCSEMTPICKCVSKIWGVPSPKTQKWYESDMKCIT